MNPDVLRKDVLYPALDRLNIPRLKSTAGFHAFRHSAARLINAETGNLKITQKFLGHSNVSTTADIYTHTCEAMEREAAAALERSIFGSCSRFVRGSVPNMKTIFKNDQIGCLAFDSAHQAGHEVSPIWETSVHTPTEEALISLSGYLLTEFGWQGPLVHFNP